MATSAITVSKNLREKLGEDGAQEFVSILNQINTAHFKVKNSSLRKPHFVSHPPENPARCKPFTI